MMYVILFLCLLLLLLLVLYGFYFFAFCHPMKKRPRPRVVPSSPLYIGHEEELLKWTIQMEEEPSELVQIKSLDGKNLFGHLYVRRPEAPLVIFSHGYHGIYCRDGYGMYRVTKKNDLNILMIDARAHGLSEGDITFGIRERQDFKSWIEYVINRFGSDQPILLAGVSMGAASALMSTALGLPDNIKGIVADCGYTKPSEILKQTINGMKLPPSIFYPIIRLSAKLYGGFDLEAGKAIDAVASSQIPTLFIHGMKDSVVPVAMGTELFEHCASESKHIQYFETADHANSALTDFALYEKTVEHFISSVF